jgi:hypothetical protein
MTKELEMTARPIPSDHHSQAELVRTPGHPGYEPLLDPKHPSYEPPHVRERRRLPRELHGLAGIQEDGSYRPFGDLLPAPLREAGLTMRDVEAGHPEARRLLGRMSRLVEVKVQVAHVEHFTRDGDGNVVSSRRLAATALPVNPQPTGAGPKARAHVLRHDNGEVQPIPTTTFARIMQHHGDGHYTVHMKACDAELHGLEPSRELMQEPEG